MSMLTNEPAANENHTEFTDRLSRYPIIFRSCCRSAGVCDGMMLRSINSRRDGRLRRKRARLSRLSTFDASIPSNHK